MRVSLITLCTLAACAVQDCPVQAQELPETETTQTDISAPLEPEPIATPPPAVSPAAPQTAPTDPISTIRPEAPPRVLFSPSSVSSDELAAEETDISPARELVQQEPPADAASYTCSDREAIDTASPLSSKPTGEQSSLEAIQDPLAENAHPCVLAEEVPTLQDSAAGERIATDATDGADPEENILNTASPLERPPGRLLNMETANQLPADALQISVGTHQTLQNDLPGTGNQLYYSTVEWGVTEDIQLGLAYQNFDDPPAEAINGERPNISLESIAPSIKYRIIETEQFSAAVQGSVEYLSLSSELFNSQGDDSESIVGSLQVPLTYTASPELQLHLTPGVSFFPDEINNREFYDTIFTVGTGVSWQPSDRWLAYGALNFPIGPGGNAIDSDNGSIERQAIWTVGTRYNVTPKVGVDIYATNGFGSTPATGILAFIPDGDNPLLGVRLNYTPDIGLGYRSSYRETALAPPSERDRQLQLDGFTLTTANTLEPGTVSLGAGAGTDGNYGVTLAYSPDQDFQIEAILEEFADGASPADTAGDSLKYMVGARLQLMDQRRGDPVSLGARVLGGRDTASGQQIGTLVADVPVTYQANSRTALFFNPRAAAFGDETRVGVGFGVNHEVAQGLQLIGEVTPVLDERAVWSVGTRYSLPSTAVSFDLYATNGIGRTGLGTLVGQSETRLGLGLNWIVGR